MLCCRDEIDSWHQFAAGLISKRAVSDGIINRTTHNSDTRGDNAIAEQILPLVEILCIAFTDQIGDFSGCL